MAETDARRFSFDQNLLLFILLSLLWGSTWLPLKVAAEHIPPVMLAAARFVIAGPLFFLIAPSAPRAVRHQHLPRLLGCALLMNSGNYALLSWGVAQAPSGLSAIVNFAAIPISFIVIGAVTGSERPSAARLLSVALGIFGVILLFWSQAAKAGAQPQAALGLVACALAAAFYCGGAVLCQPLLPLYPPTTIAGWQGVIGGAALAVLSLAIEPLTAQHFEALLHWPVAVSILAMAIGGSLAGFTIFLMLLKAWGPFRSGLYAFVSPAVAVALGMAFLGETLGWREWAGAALMFIATALAIRPAGSLPSRPNSAA